jgi:hypothetical protein
MTSKAELPFNSPLESALRSLFLLGHALPTGLDLQRIITCDYFLVHSADVGGPPSLHPAGPNRSGELLVRRRSVQSGLDTLLRKGLAIVRSRHTGLEYVASPAGVAFLNHFESSYAGQLRTMAQWVNDTFGHLSDDELRAIVDGNLGKWGTEFALEPALEGEI